MMLISESLYPRVYPKSSKMQGKVARNIGFEPMTSGFVGTRSIVYIQIVSRNIGIKKRIIDWLKSWALWGFYPTQTQ
jgi:hypothetical protein